MGERTRHHLSVFAAGAALVFSASSLDRPAHADAAAFYSQNPLTVLIGYPAGGGYDLHARTVGRHLTKHLPGQPTVVPRNMPGAGSLTATNCLYNQAPKDGSHIGTFSRGLITEPLVGGQGVRFEPRNFNWIGSPIPEVSVVFTWHESPIQTTADLFTQETLVSATGSGADSARFPLLMNALIGTKFKVITGYSGAAETHLAIERGEVHGSGGTSWSGLKGRNAHWIEDRKINVLLQFSSEPHPTDLKGIPLVTDFVRTEADRQALEVILARQIWAYPLAAPPGVPADRVRLLRAAFDAVMTDPEYVAEMKQQDVEPDPISGERIQKLVEAVYRTPPDVVARLNEIMANPQGIQGR